MKSDKPFQKSLVCSAVLFAITGIIVVAAGASNPAFALGYHFAPCLLAFIVTGLWGYFSKTAWSWIRFSITVFVLYAFFIFFPSAMKVVMTPAKEIERKMFSMSLPTNWTENKKSPLYNPDSFVFFQNSQSWFFAMIRTKSEGASAADMLNGQKQTWEKKMTETRFSDIEKWGNYEGQGVKIEGKLEGASYRTSLFAFESAGYACVIAEGSTPDEYKTLAADFEKIRQTFKLK